MWMGLKQVLIEDLLKIILILQKLLVEFIIKKIF